MSLTVLENGSEQTLKPDLLYKIVETKAPQNYQKDDTPHYVLFHKSNETPQTAFDTATGKGTAMDGEKIIQFEDVQVGSAAQTTTAQYTNRYSNLTVSKLWLDADTRQPVEPAVDSIHIKVWQYTDNDKDRTLFAEADLTAGNNWTWSESGDKLPLTDKNGNAYHYPGGGNDHRQLERVHLQQRRADRQYHGAELRLHRLRAAVHRRHGHGTSGCWRRTGRCSSPAAGPANGNRTKEE